MANQRDCVFWNYCVRVLAVIYVAIAVRYGFVLFFSLSSLFCISECGWLGEEAERLWKQKASWNSDSVWKCHSGVSLGNSCLQAGHTNFDVTNT